MQCKNSHNRKVVPCYTSKFSSFGTCWNCCAPEGPRIPSLPGARPPHACSQGSHPRLMPCSPGKRLTRLDPTSRAAWRLSLPHCSTRASLPRRDAVCEMQQVLLTCRPPAISTWRGEELPQRVTQPSGQEGKGCAVSTSVLWPPPVHGQPQRSLRHSLM